MNNIKSLYIHGVNMNNPMNGNIVTYHPISKNKSSLRKVSIKILY